MKELTAGITGRPMTEPLMFYTSEFMTNVSNAQEANDAKEAVAKGTPKPWEKKPIKPLY